jgi:hypothetical protein
MKKDNKVRENSNISLFSFLLFGFSFDKSAPKSKTLFAMLFIFALLFGGLILFLIKMASVR